jgi:hypothetical protein
MLEFGITESSAIAKKRSFLEQKMCVKEKVLFFCSKNKPQKSPYTMTKLTALMRKAEPDAKKKFSKLCLICSNRYIIVAVCCVGCVFCPDCELSGSLL